MISDLFRENKKNILILSSVIIIISIFFKSYGIRALGMNDGISSAVNLFLHYVTGSLIALTTIVFCYYYRLYALGVIIGIQLVVVLVVFILASLGIIPDRLLDLGRLL